MNSNAFVGYSLAVSTVVDFNANQIFLSGSLINERIANATLNNVQSGCTLFRVSHH